MPASISLSSIASLAIGWALVSCSAASPGLAGAKASILSSYGGAACVSVYLEGSDGDSVTGARVCASNPAGATQVLGFDEERGCYFGSFDTPLSGVYRVSVASVLLGSSPKDFGIEHDPPSGAPTAIECADSDGDSALAGQALRHDEAIELRWAAVRGASVYSIQLSEGTRLAYQGSSAANCLAIPAGALPAGSYDVRIEGQWMEGDPCLVATDTFSASASEPYCFALALD